MMGFTGGKVIELNARGFVIETSTGYKLQIATMHDGRKLGLKLGDEVKVNGGMNKDVFASSTIDVYRSGEWKEIKDAPRLIGSPVFLIAIACCIAVFFIIIGGALFWFVLR